MILKEVLKLFNDAYYLDVKETLYEYFCRLRDTALELGDFEQAERFRTIYRTIDKN